MATTVNILHLSDLHFGIEKGPDRSEAALAQRKNTCDGLVKSLSALSDDWRPHIIAISGDIAWKASPGDYDEARSWVENLLKSFSLTPDRLILAPGNHDILRSATRGMGLPASSKEADAWLDPGEGFETMTRPFSAFEEFCRTLKVPASRISSRDSYLIGMREILGLRFITLNTAWFCRGDKDKGNLWIGLPHLQILNAAGNLVKPDAYDVDPVTIALFHHPPDLWNDNEKHVYGDRVNTDRYLAERTHLLLCGHVHDHLPEPPDRKFNAAYLYTGGATYQGNQYYNHCGILRIDTAGRTCQKRCLVYDPKTGSWRHEDQRAVSLKKTVLSVPHDAAEVMVQTAAAFKPYLQSALKEHRYLPIKGYVTNFRATIEIKNIYVNMRAHVHATEFDYTMDGMRRLKEFEEREQLTDLDLKAALKAAEKRNIKDLVILGNPGSGKTTLLKYILVMLAEGKSEETIGLDSRLIPFFAPLRELRDPAKQDFITFISQQCKLADFAIAPDDFRALLETGRAILLLDGLDEVADATMRIKTCHWIDKARAKFSNARFIVTSRYAGYFGESRLECNLIELAIQDFNMQEIEQFLNYWFETIELLLHPVEDEKFWRKEAETEAVDLFENIKKNPHVRALSTNPLMLQIIACIRKDRGTVLPERRVELYQECVEVFLDRWDLSKNMPVAFRGREARAILQPLALWLHEKENRRSAPLDDIIMIIRKPLEQMNKSDVDPKKLLLNIRDRSGIFMGYNETEYGFTHLSFQEYLAAEEIRKRVMADPNAIDLLVKNYGNRWWREVTLLCLALDNPPIIDQFMEKVVYEKAFETEPTIVSDAMKEAVSKPFDLISTLINSGQLSTAAQANLTQIMHEHGKGVFTKGVHLKLPAMRLAKPFKSEKVFNEKDLSEMVLIPAGNFLYGSREDDTEASTDEKPQQSLYLPDYYMGVYPVTNEQYCRFLNEVRPDKVLLKQWVRVGEERGWLINRILHKKDKYYVEQGKGYHPIYKVSWYGAAAYAKWADCRLPLEVEWEKAARGLDGRKYPWGNEFSEETCNFGAKYNRTTDVGRFKNGISPYGCFDMAGNVWEWCADWYSDNNRKNIDNPLKGPDKGDYRVLRGGSWVDGQSNMRCAYRGRIQPYGRNNDVGFRLVR